MVTRVAPRLELKNVSKNYVLDSGAELRVLRDLNLVVESDTVVALLGPSGSGKSTCLRIMCGLTAPSSGQVLVDGEPLLGINHHVSMVFQSFALLPWETVYRNIELALSSQRLRASEVRERVSRVVDLVGLEGFEEAYPRELSGGMKQRVGIARALAMDRPIMFLDEPFSALDVLTADTLRWEMSNIWQAKNTAVKTMVLVTHNIQEAVFMAKRILVMGTNPGHIRTEITNDLPFPRDEKALGFRRMVDRIHELIAETYMPDAPPPTGPAALLLQKSEREPPIESLPDVRIGAVIGLIEAIGDHGGIADIFELSHRIQKDFGTTLYMAKAAELLELVDTPRHNVILTDLGKRFVDADINTRKRVLHELFGSLRIVQLTTNLLRASEHLRIPIDTLHARITEWLPNENPHTLVDVLVDWGRFAEYFGYNDDTKEIYLDIGQEHA
jgi:NitT/TauT family transport system ATP-binding protein